MSIPCEFSYTRESRMDPLKRICYEGIMDTAEKLKRALQDDWELVGDPWQLCQILRAEVHRLKKVITLAECQHLGCGGTLMPSEIVSAMRNVLNGDVRGDESFRPGTL